MPGPIMSSLIHRTWRLGSHASTRVVNAISSLQATVTSPFSPGPETFAIGENQFAMTLRFGQRLPRRLDRGVHVDVQLESALRLRFLRHDFLRDARIGWAPTTRR